MYYNVRVNDHIRVPPDKFGMELEEALIQEIKNKYEGFVSKELGFVIDVTKINNIKDGVIIPGDGASYYETDFELITFIPELQEVVKGKIRDIADFGVFITLGATEGMIHISQTMNDFVSLSKDNVLLGKETKRNLRVGDKCRARIIAISFKDINNPKIGLTMRQPWLGKEEWIIQEREKKGGKKSSESRKK